MTIVPMTMISRGLSVYKLVSMDILIDILIVAGGTTGRLAVCLCGGGLGGVGGGLRGVAVRGNNMYYVAQRVFLVKILNLGHVNLEFEFNPKILNFSKLQI